MKELYQEQLKKKRNKSIKQKQKELEEKIIKYCALYMDTFLKDTDKGQNRLWSPSNSHRKLQKGQV